MIFRCFFDRFRPIQKDARRPYDSFPPIITPRAPSCVRKRRFPCLRFGLWEIHGTKEPRYPGLEGIFLCGRRFTRPSSDCPVGWHTDDAPWEGRVRDRPSLERPGSRPVLAQNQGVSPRASRRGFFRPQKHVPGFFGSPKGPFLLKT